MRSTGNTYFLLHNNNFDAHEGISYEAIFNNYQQAIKL